MNPLSYNMYFRTSPSLIDPASQHDAVLTIHDFEGNNVHIYFKDGAMQSFDGKSSK